MSPTGPWMTPRLLRLQRGLAWCAALDGLVLLASLALLLAPRRAAILMTTAVEWTGLPVTLSVGPDGVICGVAIGAAGLGFGVAAWANPRRHALTARTYGDLHLAVAALAALSLVVGDRLDLARWGLVLVGALAASAVRLTWKPAALPLLRQRDSELLQGGGWTFDRLAGSPRALLQVVMARGPGPDAEDLVGLEYRALRLHPVHRLLGRARALLGFFDAPSVPWVEGYHLPMEQGGSDWTVLESRCSGFFDVLPAPPGGPLPGALVLDGPRSRRNVEGDPAARWVLRLVMPRAGDPTLLLGHLSLRLGSVELPMDHVVLKAWRRHRYTGEEPAA